MQCFVQLLFANEGTIFGPVVDEPLHIQTPGPAPATFDPVAAYVPSFEEFLPLVKGRTLKIRDTFEAGTLVHRTGSVWSKLISVEHAPRGTGAPKGETLPVTPGMESSSRWLGHLQPCRTTRCYFETCRDIIRDRCSDHGQDRGRQHPWLGFASLAGGAANLGGHTNGLKTMAEILREKPDPNGPQVFVPEKITNIGYATTSNGLPAICFSGAEIQKLADNIGYAIVGRFSHSIPNSKQIQKTLDNIKLVEVSHGNTLMLIIFLFNLRKLRTMPGCLMD